MAERDITFINDLDNMKDDYTLKVCIIRLWRSISDVSPTIVKSLKMILMDKMGTKIRASVYPRDFERSGNSSLLDPFMGFDKIFNGDEVECLSSDGLCQSEFVHDQFDVNLYSPGVLNGLKISAKVSFSFSFSISPPGYLQPYTPTPSTSFA
ncbi:unnamed protein product [Lactuca virosa]|uniref:Replication protein A 70 kDa DNA-binding subunit B/D first OB fold domain-containing protein n=1 Tax=Lactuca virosa TaxID=75947 RepID=A0AAU9NY82_9ASTR|nr:unnamed protein product [Lactuca virosa]